MQRSAFPTLIALLALLVGCASPAQLRAPVEPGTAERESVDWPRDLPIFASHTGQRLHWNDLLAAGEWAQIIVIGEQHDDAVGHAVQRAVAEDMFDRWPDSALSLEMIERDHQVLVDDYLEGIIDQETFINRAHLANWAGPDTWVEWYQPIVDVAKNAGGDVIAANAPRRYVRLARTDGYDRLRALPRERRRLFDLPRRLPENHYWQRFAEVMSQTPGHGAPDEDDEENDNGDHASVNHDPNGFIRAIFRSQMVWDATMARSIVDARPTRRAKVIHLCGRFHSDFEGGTIMEIRRHRPWARVLVISMNPIEADQLREEDVGRADIVIYTGEPDDDPPDEPEEEEEEEEDV